MNDVDSNGISRKVNPKETYWYKNYFLFPKISCKTFQKRFRLRFRLPHSSFKILLNSVSTSHHFAISNPTYKRDRSPISLLLLVSLRYLGRGWTFDDLEESTGISAEVHRIFFHKSLDYGVEILYPRFVKYPTTSQEGLTHSLEFNKAGMHGAIGSMDACHITIEKCSHRLKQNHLGGKSKLTCRSYNLTCNHRRQILHTTPGHPARWNDKTIVLYDSLAKGLKNGTIMQDNIFELFERSDTNEIVTKKYRGAWLVVDNGYLNWGVTIPPMKNTMFISETRWSQWLESMRIDVKCTFGILKGRFRILKAGIRCLGVEVADKIWKTCCALHNMLLEVDGITGEWDGVNGLFDFDMESEKIPFALQRLANPSEQRNYDSSGMGPGVAVNYVAVDDDNDDHTIPNPAVNAIIEDDDSEGIYSIRLMTADYFQSKLIEHFDILYLQYKIKWTSRIETTPTNIII